MTSSSSSPPAPPAQAAEPRQHVLYELHLAVFGKHPGDGGALPRRPLQGVWHQHWLTAVLHRARVQRSGQPGACGAPPAPERLKSKSKSKSNTRPKSKLNLKRTKAGHHLIEILFSQTELGPAFESWIDSRALPVSPPEPIGHERLFSSALAAYCSAAASPRLPRRRSELPPRAGWTR